MVSYFSFFFTGRSKISKRGHYPHRADYIGKV
jgi:hypothetical protein